MTPAGIETATLTAVSLLSPFLSYCRKFPRFVSWPVYGPNGETIRSSPQLIQGQFLVTNYFRKRRFYLMRISINFSKQLTFNAT